MGSSVSAGRRTRRAAVLATLAVLALLVGYVDASGAQSVPTTFETASYGTGAQRLSTSCWRGFPFAVAQDTTVTALIGGGTEGTTETGLVTSAAIFAGMSTDGSNFTITQLVASAAFPGSSAAVRQSTLDTPVTLRAGRWYFLAAGSNQAIVDFDTGDGGQYVVAGYDSSLAAANPLFLDWGPPTANKSLSLSDGPNGCHGSVESVIGRTASGESSRIPDIGFVYDAAPATTTTTADTTTTVAGDPVTTPTFTG